MNYACTEMIDASILLYFSFDSSLSLSRSMEQAVPAVHLTFYRLVVVIRDMSDIYRYSDHSLLPSQSLYTQQHWQWLLWDWQMIDTIHGVKSSAIIYSIVETAKANNLKPFDYVEYLLEEIPKHMDDKERSFLKDLLPWSEKLPAKIRKA